MSTQIQNWNFKLISHHELSGFGNVGEGIAQQKTKDGRYILWLAHEGPPKAYTGLDVTDPKNPQMIVQADLPETAMRSNSVAVAGDLMVVCYQARKPGDTPAGLEVYDISVPENPKKLSFLDRSGPYSRGVHQAWFVDGRYVHMSSGAADFQPHDQRDDQFYQIIDLVDPTNPVEVGRWWLPGTRIDEEPIKRHPQPHDSGFRAHNTNVYPERPDRAYLGYLDGGMVTLDISDMSAPKMIAHWDNSPPFNGFTHTILPLFNRGLAIVTDEATKLDGSDLPKLVWVVDNRDETNPTPIATFPTAALPEVVRDASGRQVDRIGAHNLHENTPNSWFSDEIILGAFFGGGLRAYDISNPFQPVEVGYFIPPASEASPTGCISLNDVFVDDRGIVFVTDRHAAGVFVLEMDF